MIDHYILAKKYTDIHGYDYGIQYAEYLVRPIPRGFWPDKPEQVAIRMRYEFWGEKMGGIPPTVFGEFYMSFGYIGLIIGSIFLGVILGLLERIYQRIYSEPEISVVYAIMVAFIVFSVTRSGLDISFVKIVSYLSFLIIFKMMLMIRVFRNKDLIEG